MDLSGIGQAPAAANLESGALCVWVAVDLGKSLFEQQTLMRKAVQALMEESPAEINFAVYGNEEEKSALAQLAVYVAWINGAPLPSRKTGKKDTDNQPLEKITLHGYREPTISNCCVRKRKEICLRVNLRCFRQRIDASTLSRPPEELAEVEHWKYQDFDLKKLREMGAGAFVAVAQGSDQEDAAIVHLQRRVKNRAQNRGFGG